MESSIEDVQVYTEKAIKMGMEYGPRLLLAILVLLIGLSIIRSIVNFVRAALKRRSVDETLAPFIVNVSGWTLKALLLVSVASMVGIETTSFVAALGAAGLAIGLALQGSLSNFAGGVLILLFRPFEKGDYIEAQGFSGTVEKIDIYATTLVTFENQRIILPNGPLIGGCIQNNTAQPVRRVDLPIGIGYGDNVKKAQEALIQMCKNHPKVISDHETLVHVTEYGDSSINLMIKTWCKTENYWDVYFDLNQKIKEVLDSNSLNIPFPQRDVHIFKTPEH